MLHAPARYISSHRIVIALLLILCIGYVISRAVLLVANCDIGWLTYAAEKAANGKLLYADLYEINPPLVFLFHFASNAIASWLGTDMIATYFGLSSFIALFCFLVSLGVLKPLCTSWPATYALTIGLFIFSFLLPFNVRFFGEREHLFIAFITPYLMLHYLVICGVHTLPWKKTALALGIIGFMFKPYFLVIFAAIEWAILSTNTRRFKQRIPLYFGAGITGCSYILLVYLFTPTYLTDVIWVAMQTYDAHQLQNRYILELALKMGYAASMVFMLYALAPESLDNKKIRYWIGLVVAACALPFLQFKGWDYLYFPAKCMCFLAFLFALYETVDNKKYLPVSVGKRERYQQSTLILLVILVMFSNFYTLNMSLNDLTLHLTPLIFFMPALLAMILMRQDSFAPHQIFLFTLGILLLCISSIPNLAMVLVYIALPSSWALCFIALALGILICKHTRFTPAFRHNMFLTLLFFTGALNGFLIGDTFNYTRNVPYSALDYNPSMAEMKRNIESKKRVKSIFIFNTSLYPGFPMVNYTGVDWASRYHHLWMLPKIYDEATPLDPCYVPDKFIPLRDAVYEAVYADLQKYEPEWLAYDLSPYIFLKKKVAFTWKRCIKEAHPKLDAYLNKHYQLDKKVDFCADLGETSCAFSIYDRRRKNGRK